MRKQYIFIDFDGTLVNTSSGIFYALDYAYEKMKIQGLSDMEKGVYIGPPLIPSFKKFAKMNDEQAAEALKHFRKAYSEKGVNMHTLYDGVKEMLEGLYERGKTLVVATSKPEMFAVKILNDYSLAKYFTAVCGATANETRVTKHDVLEYAIDTVKMKNPSDGVLIGDTDNDCIGAKSVGIDCIGVLYGFGTKKQLIDSGAIETAEFPTDILTIIE